jgi:tetratricopeptide (TPR) repeat protein
MFTNQDDEYIPPNVGSEDVLPAIPAHAISIARDADLCHVRCGLPTELPLMSRRVSFWVLGVAMFAVLVATYSNHFDNEFHFDDSHVIEQNTYMREINNIPLFFTEAEALSTLPTNRTYRPVLLATFAVDYWIGDGLDPFAFHVTSFAVLVAVAAMMVLLYRRLMDMVKPHPANLFIALAMAAWFALHTANAETINYISARSDSLSTLAVVSAMVVYMYARDWKRHLSLVIVGIGMLIKANVVMIVPIFFLYELLFVSDVSLWAIFARDSRKLVVRALARTVPIAVVSVAMLIVAYLLTPSTFSAGGPSAFWYALTQPFVMLRYAWTFVVPIGLSADTDWVAFDTVFDLRFAAGALFVLSAVALAVFTSIRRATRPVSFGILWFFLALAWTSSVIPRAEVTNDHRMFFPFVGLTLAVGWALALVGYRYEERVRSSKPLIVGISLALVLALSLQIVGTWQRNEVWDTEESLWLDVTDVSPLNGRGLMNYGVTQMAAGRYAVAVDYFERAKETEYGSHPYLFVNLAVASSATNVGSEEVEALFITAVQNGQGFPETHYHYARWLYGEGRVGEASAEVNIALSLSPGHRGALALRDEIGGADGGSLEAAQRAVSENPSAETYLELSLAFFLAERFEESLAAAQQATIIDSGYSLGFNNVCAAYNAMDEFALAVVACRRALELDPVFQLAQANLDWAVSQLAAGR